jgi:hypothetical protein
MFDRTTTTFGLIVGVIQAANIDFALLLQGDPKEIGKLVTALATAAWGYFTNKGGNR